jgi:hypothetical protein
MTRLDRVLNLLEQYDQLSTSAINNECEQIAAERWLEKLRKEKDQLTQELIEHGCRRKN